MDLKAERMAKAAILMEEELAIEQKIEGMRQARGGSGTRMGGSARMHKIKSENEPPRGIFQQLDSMQPVMITTTYTQTAEDGLPYIPHHAVVPKSELNTPLNDCGLHQQDWASESGVTSPSTDQEYSISESYSVSEGVFFLFFRCWTFLLIIVET